VIAIFGFLQPPVLAVRFAGLSAGRLGTIALTPHVAVIGIKESLAVQTLACSDVTSHWPASPQVNDLHITAWKEEDWEDKAEGRGEKTREEVEKYQRSGKKTEQGEPTLSTRPLNNTFTLPLTHEGDNAQEGLYPSRFEGSDAGRELRPREALSRDR
jgi:hypothetical protein